jgi:REP element-mobilizing transposase RayT
MSEKYKYRNPEGIYFVTSTVVFWIDVFTRNNHKQTIIESLEYCQQKKGLIIYAWVLMSSHLHMIVKAKDGNLSDIFRDFKKYTSKEIIKNIKEYPESRREWLLRAFERAGKDLKRITTYKFWHDGNHPIELDSKELVDEKLQYIHQNPVEEMIVMNIEDYWYSSAKNYRGMEGLLKVELIT